MVNTCPLRVVVCVVVLSPSSPTGGNGNVGCFGSLEVGGREIEDDVRGLEVRPDMRGLAVAGRVLGGVGLFAAGLRAGSF